MNHLFMLLDCNTTIETAIITLDRVLGVTAISLSIITLILSVRYNRKTLRLTENHNKITIKPFIVTQSSSEIIKGKYSCSILNSGLGPAIIINNYFVYKNKNYENIRPLLKDIVGEWDYLITQKDISISKLDNREVISPGSTQHIYNFELPKQVEFSLVSIELSEVSFHVEYEDAYGNEFKKSFDQHPLLTV